MTGRVTILGLIALLASAGPQTALQAQGSLPEWGRPLAPAEGRELRAEIGRLSRRLGIREAALVAIARVLGATLQEVGFAELIRRVQAQAERAAELQSQIAELRTQLAAVTDPNVRSPAELALARATSAFNEGRLDDADREFAVLESLRRSESAAAQAAWLDAVDARARIAELRLDFDAAEALRLAALRAERFLSARRQWRLAREAAEARLRQGDLLGDNAALERAIVLFRDDALPLAPRSERPLDWALTQNDLGNALWQRGSREVGTSRLELAIAAYEEALREYRRESVPMSWAMVQNNLGLTLTELGQRETGTARLEQAVTALEAALDVRTREHTPYEWAVTLNNLGIAFRLLGEREAGNARLEQAIHAFETALIQFTPDGTPLHWVGTQTNLGNALAVVGDRENSLTRLEQAIRAYSSALAVITREHAPLRWALAQHNLANALSMLGERQSGTQRMEQAVQTYEAALEEWTRDRAPIRWAEASVNLAHTLTLIFGRTGRLPLLDAAEQRVRQAQEVLAGGGHARGLRWADHVLRTIMSLRARTPN